MRPIGESRAWPLPLPLCYDCFHARFICHWLPAIDYRLASPPPEIAHPPQPATAPTSVTAPHPSQPISAFRISTFPHAPQPPQRLRSRPRQRTHPRRLLPPGRNRTTRAHGFARAVPPAPSRIGPEVFRTKNDAQMRCIRPWEGIEYSRGKRCRTVMNLLLPRPLRSGAHSGTGLRAQARACTPGETALSWPEGDFLRSILENDF